MAVGPNVNHHGTTGLIHASIFQGSHFGYIFLTHCQIDSANGLMCLSLADFFLLPRPQLSRQVSLAHAEEAETQMSEGHWFMLRPGQRQSQRERRCFCHAWNQGPLGWLAMAGRVGLALSEHKNRNEDGCLGIPGLCKCACVEAFFRQAWAGRTADS